MQARDHLLQVAPRAEAFLRIASEIEAGLAGPLRLRGLCAGAASLLAGHLFETSLRSRAPLVWILPDAESAEAARDDLEFLIGEEHVLHFPELESLPYDRGGTAPQVISTRLATLDALAGSGPAPAGANGAPAGSRKGTRKGVTHHVVVTSFRAIAGRLMPPKRLAASTIDLSVGQEVAPGLLKLMLVDLGYRHETVVSALGEFSARGGILDIFASGGTEPLRIEWDGDEIVSMRTFDLQSQRSTGQLKHARVLPRRELIPDPKRVDDIVNRLRQAGSPQAEELVHQVQEERIFDGMERLLSYYEPELVSFFDYLSRDAVFFVTDWSRQRSRADAFADEVEVMYQEAKREWGVASSPDELFLSPRDIERELWSRPTLLQDGVTVGPRDAREIECQTEAAESFARNLDLFRERLRSDLAAGWDVMIFCDNTGQRERLEELLEDIPVRLDIAVWGAGFTLHQAGLKVYTDHEIFSRYRQRLRRGKFRGGLTYEDFLALAVGDYVVHAEHGIGVYRGLTREIVDGQETDCLRIEYAAGDRLLLPVSQLAQIQKYQAEDAGKPSVHRLGSNQWQKTKAKIKKAIKEMADQLIRTYAARRALPGHAYGPDEDLMRQLEASFIYDETRDQLTAVEAVKVDMETPRPMDRLVCGDVGYGKTEVAVRAAMKAVVGGKQVAVLVPTTILAQQHFNTFSERLAGFPVRVDMLSRFRSPREQKETVSRLASGDVDIIVGTHRLLSKDIIFRDLGLVVIDEEHRFGVAHKERLRTMRQLVDVLTLTATPIPRTLNLALLGARDMSRIETPPRDRLPIHTEVVEFEPEIIADSLLREADRGGQSFFVHNRVESIEPIALFLRKLCPQLKFGVAHGQMREHALERVMLDFLDRKYDCLVSTMIIESGLDIPTVNTLLVHHAESLGLAQLYQLRGRVGRSHHRAYCYLIVPKRRALTEIAEKRLKVIQEYDELGSGLKIAMKDLEIRGAGNLLGPEQTGFIISVGFEMYCRLLEEAVSEVKGEPMETLVEPRLITNLPAFLPDHYVDPQEKISQYKRLADARTVEQVDKLAEEWRDRFGEMPESAVTILELRRLRLLAAGGEVSQLIVETNRFEIELANPRPAAQLRPLFELKDYKLEIGAADPTRMSLRVKGRPGLEAGKKVLPKVMEALGAAAGGKKAMQVSKS